MRKTTVLIINTLRRLSLAKLMKLFRLTIPHPIFSLLSFYATVQSFVIAKKHFPKSSSTNGIGNAFRHALWCCLIMMYCCKISSPKKALKWCKKMTDMHEELFPNQPLETKMDLHNNKIGMDLFMEMLPGIHRQFFEKSFFINALFEKLKTALIIRNVEDDPGNELVYLTEN